MWYFVLNLYHHFLTFLDLNQLWKFTLDKPDIARRDARENLTVETSGDIF